MITETEAREKWCPMTRLGTNSGAVFNRFINDEMLPSKTKCIGSDCMMWREVHKTTSVPVGRGHVQVPDGDVDLGYCGLAGRP